MELNVILASVVVAAMVSAIFNIITLKMSSHAKRKDFRYAKLYDIFDEIQKYQAPLHRQHENQTIDEMKDQYIIYFEFLSGKYELAKPLLSNKIIKEIDADIKKLASERDTSKAPFDLFDYRLEYRGIIIKGIQKQLKKLK